MQMNPDSGVIVPYVNVRGGIIANTERTPDTGVDESGLPMVGLSRRANQTEHITFRHANP